MEFSAMQIAGILDGEIDGDENTTVVNLSKIEEGKPKTLSFLSNPAYNHYLYTTDASIVIVNKSLQLEKPVKSTCTLIKVDDAREAFAKLLDLYNQFKNNKVGVEQPSYIGPKSTYGEDCYIGAFAYIGNRVTIGKNVKIYPQVFVGDHCVIGDNTIIYPGVKIYDQCIIGANCIIHSSTVIGSDGFGFVPQNDSASTKVPQIGNVIIEDDVEIGSNVSIDRATLGSTILRKGVKLDNLVQIAHNVEIGENTIIAGLSGVAGSTKVGRNVMIAAQVGIVGHIKIANGVKIAGQSGIGASVEKEGEILQGSPAFPVGEYRRSYVLFRNLTKLNDRIKALELKIKP